MRHYTLLMMMVIILFSLCRPLKASGKSSDMYANYKEIYKIPAHRNYYAPLNDEEKENISYIITTLANTSTIVLLTYKNHLKGRALKIKHIHPLKLLTFIYSDQALRKDFSKIGFIAWIGFRKGMSINLQIAAKHENINDDHVQDFSIHSGINYDLISPLIKKNQWHQLLDTLAETTS